MIGTGSLHFIWSQLTNKNQSFKIILFYSWVQSHHLFEPVQNLLLGAQEEGLLKRHSDKFATERHAASFLVFVLIANVFVRVQFFRQNKITHRTFHSDLCFPAILSLLSFAQLSAVVQQRSGTAQFKLHINKKIIDQASSDGQS